jgi:hypothetical protein
MFRKALGVTSVVQSRLSPEPSGSVMVYRVLVVGRKSRFQEYSERFSHARHSRSLTET